MPNHRRRGLATAGHRADRGARSTLPDGDRRRYRGEGETVIEDAGSIGSRDVFTIPHFGSGPGTRPFQPGDPLFLMTDRACLSGSGHLRSDDPRFPPATRGARCAMKVCRFDQDRVGVILTARVFDLTGPHVGSHVAGRSWRWRWPWPRRHRELPGEDLADVRLLPPVRAPGRSSPRRSTTRTMCAEMTAAQVSPGHDLTDIKRVGLFLKAVFGLRTRQRIGCSSPTGVRTRGQARQR